MFSTVLSCKKKKKEGGSGQLQKQSPPFFPHPPLKPQSLALPIIASITPWRCTEDARCRSAEVTFLLNAVAPFAPNAISPNALLPQHRSALSQHTLQVDLLPLADLITAAGGSSLYFSDWDDRLPNSPSSFRGHLILDRKTEPSNARCFNGNEMSGPYVKAVTFAYCFSILFYPFI